MFLLIVRKEIAVNILSFRFVVACALVFGLIPFSIALMGNAHRSAVQGYLTELGEARDRVHQIVKIEDPDQQFDEFQRTTFYGFRRPKDLSILARGLEGHVPMKVPGMKGFFFRSSRPDRLNRNALLSIFPTPDFVYVVNIVISLVALLFVFDAICGEKERGTLKLILSNAIPRDLLLFGKWIGGYVSVVAPFCAALLGGLVYMYVTGAMEVRGEHLVRIGLMMAASSLYISAFFSLGLMISARASRTSTALIISLLVWICWVLVLPNSAPVIARALYRAPTREGIEMEKATIDREAERMIARNGTEEKEEWIRADATARKRRLEEFYRERMKTQIIVCRTLARLSPSASFLFALTRLADTGPTLYDHFKDASEQFQKEWSDYVQSLWGNVVVWESTGRVIKRHDWFIPEALPRFRMFVETAWDSVLGASFDLLILVLYNTLFFVGAYLSFLRYDAT